MIDLLCSAVADPTAREHGETLRQLGHREGHHQRRPLERLTPTLGEQLDLPLPRQPNRIVLQALSVGTTLLGKPGRVLALQPLTLAAMALSSTVARAAANLRREARDEHLLANGALFLGERLRATLAAAYLAATD